jgi:hypothetical protein
MTLTWLDLAALITLAAALVLGIRRGLPFTLALIPTAALYLVAAQFLPHNLVFLAVLVIGLACASLVQLLPISRLSPQLEGLLGGVGGLVWGLILAVGIWVSLPSEYVASTGNFRYPSSRIEQWKQRGGYQSMFARPLFRWVANQMVLQKVFLPNVRRNAKR